MLAGWHCSHSHEVHSHCATLPDGSQGDFIEALMDSVGSELSKPAKELSEFSLNSCLDSALRASSAQYDAPDQINRLRIKLEAAQSNDDGGPSCIPTRPQPQNLRSHKQASASRRALTLAKLHQGSAGGVLSLGANLLSGYLDSSPNLIFSNPTRHPVLTLACNQVQS